MYLLIGLLIIVLIIWSLERFYLRGASEPGHPIPADPVPRGTEPTPTPPRRTWRVKQIIEEYSVTKGWVFSALKDGALRGRKVRGVLLIEAASVQELLE